MPKYKKQTWAAKLNLLEYLASHTYKQAADAFSKTEGRPISEAALRTRTNKISHEIKEMQTTMNRVRTLQRVSPRIRKLTTVGTIEDEDVGEWLEEKTTR